MNITFLSADQNMQDETTNYWFNVNDNEFALSDNNGDVKLLDCDGRPVDACSDHDGVLSEIINKNPEYWLLA